MTLTIESTVTTTVMQYAQLAFNALSKDLHLHLYYFIQYVSGVTEFFSQRLQSSSQPNTTT